MKRFASILFALGTLVMIGCAHAQPTPTKGYQTTWTWNAPTTGSCTSSCQYIVSTLNVTPGTATCPAPTGQYIPQQTSTTALTGTSWVQTPTTGLSVCAVVTTVFAGASSPASAQSSVVVSPSLPTAPGVPSGNSQQALVKPALSNTDPVLAMSRYLGAPTAIIGTARKVH